MPDVILLNIIAARLGATRAPSKPSSESPPLFARSLWQTAQCVFTKVFCLSTAIAGAAAALSTGADHATLEATASPRARLAVVRSVGNGVRGMAASKVGPIMVEAASSRFPPNRVTRLRPSNSRHRNVLFAVAIPNWG